MCFNETWVNIFQTASPFSPPPCVEGLPMDQTVQTSLVRKSEEWWWSAVRVAAATTTMLGVVQAPR